MTNAERLAKSFGKHPDWTAERRAASLEIPVADIRAFSPKGGAVPIKRGKSLHDFRSEFDKSFIVPQRIKAALKEIGASGWEYEKQFAEIAGVSLADMGNFRDEFADYIVDIRRVSKRAWAGSVGTAKAMREML